MWTQDQIQALKAFFPPEALRSATSHDLGLISIKTAQTSSAIERLDDIFGPSGIGWRYIHSPFGELHTDNGQREVVTEVAFHYCFPATNNSTGCNSAGVGCPGQRPGLPQERLDP